MSEPGSGQGLRASVELAPGAAVDVPPDEGSEASRAPPSAEETTALLEQLTGATVDGKYRVDEVIGKGAMGVVLAATHIRLKERVALKFLSTRAHSAQVDDIHSRFRREAQVSAKLRNEHITRVLDVGMWREKIPFMVMDLLVGDDLRETLKKQEGGKLPPPTALDYVVQVCEGLAEAHAHGIVHRDLKPSNLFVTRRQDGSDLVKILDFGISKWTTHEDQLEELTQTGVVLGSPKYMAPEQLFGSATVDARADVWSIGAIFYEMLAGRPPFDFPTLTRICAELAADRPPPSLSQFVPDLPSGLEAALFRCFARDRDHRVANVAELAGSLLDAVDAPIAGQVRRRIGSMLDPTGQGSKLGASSGNAPAGGDYRSRSLTGSNPGIASSGTRRVANDGSSPSTATGGGPAIAPKAREDGRRRPILLASAVGGIVGLVILFRALSGGHSPEAFKGTSAGVAATVAAPVVAVPASSAAPVAPLTSTVEMPAPAQATPAPPSPAPRGGGGRPSGGGGGGHRGGGKPAPAPPAAVTAQAPVAAPQPAPAPAPAPPAKANPLEDRQ